MNKRDSTGGEVNDDETSPLLAANGDGVGPPRITISDVDGRRSSSTFRERILSIDGTHLSPVTPWVPDSGLEDNEQPQPARWSTSLSILLNMFAVVLVCLAGVLGWWLSNRSSAGDNPIDDQPSDNHEALSFNVLGQVFGYICAALYLGSRVPQLLLNYRRKSTEGISMLFFLFACIGNLTYVLSIFAYSPVCHHPKHCEPGEASAIYAKYIGVNFSWILGSFGTLLLDAGVFVQYFLYKQDEEDEIEA